MSSLTSQTLESIKQALLKQQAEIQSNMKELEQDDPTQEEGVAETSEPGMDSSIADTHTKSVAMEEEIKKTEDSIKVALEKIAAGTYGNCDNCGKVIEEDRLLAMPTANWCVDCSAKLQQPK